MQEYQQGSPPTGVPTNKEGHPQGSPFTYTLKKSSGCVVTLQKIFLFLQESISIDMGIGGHC